MALPWGQSHTSPAGSPSQGTAVTGSEGFEPLRGYSVEGLFLSNPVGEFRAPSSIYHLSIESFLQNNGKEECRNKSKNLS